MAYIIWLLFKMTDGSHEWKRVLFSLWDVYDFVQTLCCLINPLLITGLHVVFLYFSLKSRLWKLQLTH